MPDPEVVRVVVTCTDLASAPQQSDPQEAVQQDWAWEACSLPHPRTGDQASFLCKPGCVLEVNTHTPALSSWFAGDTVIADGSLHLCTPVDPLFILLPVIEANCRMGCEAPEGWFRTAEELCHMDEPSTCWQNAIAPSLEASLACLCDCKSTAEGTFYRISPSRVLAWLQLKAQATATALNEASGAFSSMDESTMTAYSVNMVGEYLPPAWLARFQDACAVPAGGSQGMQPLTNADVVPGRQQEKRPRLDPKAIARERAKIAKTEAKAQQRAKEASTNHKLTGFFRPLQARN